jgi:hypothetical protein
MFCGTIIASVLGILTYQARGRAVKSIISPDPLSIRRAQEYVEYQLWEREHNNILARLAKVEGHYDALRDAITDQGQSTDAKLSDLAKETRTGMGNVHARLDAVIPVLFRVAGKMGVIAPAKSNDNE